MTPKVPELDDDGLDKVEDAVEKLDFEVNVDDDNMLRRALVEAEFDMPEGIPGGLEGGEVKLEVVLDEVGTDPEIRAPANALPLSLLLGQLRPRPRPRRAAVGQSASSSIRARDRAPAS